MAKPFDPFDLSRFSLGAAPQPLLGLLGAVTGRAAGPGTVTEYLRLWLQSLSQASRDSSGDGSNGIVPEMMRQAMASLHRGESTAPPGADHAALAANLESLARELASGDWEQTAELIKRIHAARASGSTAPAPGEAATPVSAVPSPAEPAAKRVDTVAVSGYDRARRHLLEHEEEERRRAWLTDRILDQLRSPNANEARPSNPLQSELRLTCPVQGRTSGRFRVANATDRDLEIELRASPVQGAPPGWGERLPVHFEAPHGGLRRGAEGVVKVAVDTAGCPLNAGAVLELVVDVVGSGQLLHKVWVSIEVTGEP